MSSPRTSLSSTTPAPSAQASTLPAAQLAVSNGVLLAAVIFLFMVVVFVFLLYLYAKRFLGANPLLSPSSPRFLFASASPMPRRGLAVYVLQALPIEAYDASSGEALECAVCLSEVASAEKVRRLPKCGHSFHVGCIDMWFHSHDTCPLCRAPVGADAEAPAAVLPSVPREEPVEFPIFPTNVLFWGTHDNVTNTGSTEPPPAPAASSSSGTARTKESLVIDIPSRVVAVDAVASPLPVSRMAGGGSDEMRSPVSARLRSLRRLLSRGKQAVVGPSSSPRSGSATGDIEQGFPPVDTARPPKTPKTPKTPPAN